MKAVLLGVATAALGLAGCASMQSTEPSQAKVVKVQEVDYEAMQLVDNYAKRRGMSVYWLQYPNRYVAARNTAGVDKTGTGN